jgi:tripartite-type tricarboxylate transporter receptor subunit TctC
MFRFIRGISITCALLAGTALAQAEGAYPDRPIHVIVAFTPGGATDTLTRQLSEEMQKTFGQPLVVENRPGANGYLAWNYVASADPDGYTLLMAENALGISQGLFKKKNGGFDPLKQYDALASVAYSPLTLVLASKIPVNTMKELIAYSKTVPKKMNYGSAGIGSVSHLNWEVIKAGAGIDAVNVHYKGGGQAMSDIIAGVVDMNMAAVSVAKPLVENGRIKALVVTGNARSPALPNVPTLAESGIKTDDVDLRFWYGLFGPKGIPDAVKAKIEKTMETVMNAPNIRARLASLDISPDYAPGPVMRKKLENEITNWSKFIDAHGIKAE